MDDGTLKIKNVLTCVKKIVQKYIKHKAHKALQRQRSCKEILCSFKFQKYNSKNRNLENQ